MVDCVTVTPASSFPHLRQAVLAMAIVLIGAACSSGSTTGAVGGASDDGGRATSRAEQPLTALTGGDPLPEFSLPELARGDADTLVTTASWLGTPTIVNFWATWCGFCVEEMPDFQAVHESLGDKVRFVGVDRSANESSALDFIEAAGVTYDLVEDTNDDFYFAVQARGMPTTLFVDADGVIQHRNAGPLSQEMLKDLIAEHLGVATP